MAWQANIDKSGIENRQLVVYATYFSSTDKQPKILVFSAGSTYQDVANKIQSDLNDLNNQDTVSTKIPTGLFVFPTPTPPTSGEQARIDYAVDLRLFGQMTRAISAGVKTVSDQNYVDVLKRLQTNFINSYIDLF